MVQRAYRFIRLRQNTPWLATGMNGEATTAQPRSRGASGRSRVVGYGVIPLGFATDAPRLAAGSFTKQRARSVGRKAFRFPRCAFTLVELMVVLAIIAMLAGLLLYFIGDARSRARAVHCRNNLRQFGIAIGKYASDCDGYFIHPGKGGGGGGGALAIPHPSGADGILVKDPTADKNYAKPYSVVRDLTFEYGIRDGVGTVLGYGSSIGGDTYRSFVAAYVSTNNDVTHCPEVDQAVFVTNSPKFKGFAQSVQEDNYGVYTQSWTDVSGKQTSYAINGNAQHNLKSIRKDYEIAFIDWNAAQGWGAALAWSGASNHPYTQTWVMAHETVGSAVSHLYGEAGQAKTGCWYQTEIGYHHRSGTNRYANYVAMDGRIDWISPNTPMAHFYNLFTGN